MRSSKQCELDEMNGNEAAVKKNEKRAGDFFYCVCVCVCESLNFLSFSTSFDVAWLLITRICINCAHQIRKSRATHAHAHAYACIYTNELFGETFVNKLLTIGI